MYLLIYLVYKDGCLFSIEEVPLTAVLTKM